MLFLVKHTVDFPHDLPESLRRELLARERESSQRAQQSGRIVGIWRVTGHFANVALYEVASNDELHEAISELPMFPYLRVEITPLSAHPNSIK